MKETIVKVAGNEIQVQYDKLVPEIMHKISTTTQNFAVIKDIDMDDSKCFVNPILPYEHHLREVIDAVLNTVGTEGFKEIYLPVQSPMRPLYLELAQGAVVTYFSKTDSYLMKFAQCT